MSPSRVLAAASVAVAFGGLSVPGLSPSSALAVPIFRVDVDSDNLAEQSNPNAAYSETEGGPLDTSIVDNGGNPRPNPFPATVPPFESWKINGGLGTPEDPDFGDPRLNSPVYTGTAAAPSQYRVTLRASGNEKVDTIRRFGLPPETSNFYYSSLYRDFAQATRSDTSVLPTLDAIVENNVGSSNLAPNTAYNVTLFAYDKFFDPGGNNANDPSIGNTTMHFADTTADGLGSQSDSYIFNRLAGDDQSLPAGMTLDNLTWSTTLTVFTDADGRLSIREVAQPGVAGGVPGQPGQGASASQIAPFLNGLQIDNAVNQAVAGPSTFAAPASWTLGAVPDGPSAVANFFDPAGGTVALGAAVTAGNVNFSGAGGYTLSGTRLTLESFKGPNSSVSLAARAGAHTIDAALRVNNRLYANVAAGATLTVTGDLTTGSNAYASQALFLRKTGAGTLVLANASLPTVDIQGGTLRTTRGVTKVNALTIGANAAGPVFRLDLVGSSVWAVDYAGATPATALTALLASGRAAGFTGTGITSSLAAADSRYTVGFAEAGALGVTTVPGTTVAIDNTTFLFRVTLRGDSNLDGSVTFPDLVSLAQNYNGTERSYIQGDTNFDGSVNFTDLVALAQNYNGSVTPGVVAGLGGDAFAADWGLAVSLVPEPAGLAAIGLLATAGIRRRR